MSGSAVGQAVLARYGGPPYARLLAAARKSLERTGGKLDGRISISQPDEGERKAIIGISGIHQPAGTKRLTIGLADLDAAMGRATGLGLIDVLAAIGGPVRDRPGEAASLAAACADVLGVAEASPLQASCDWYRAWIAELAGDGSLTRFARQGDGELVAQAVRTLEYLALRPADSRGVVELPALAARVTGDTKALNHGTAASTLVLRALALRFGAARPTTAAERRDLWDLADVIVDDLASRVLVLNLPADGSGLGQWLTDAARYGTPFQVTLHQLAVHPIRLPGSVIYVCENPAVLRRACGDGADCPPLICTEGQPSTAFRRLARVAAAAGAELRYHGDFDWPGVAIAADVIMRHQASPWLMSATDYVAGASVGDRYQPLTGDSVATPWDPALADAMRSTGRAVYEETVADQLIASLGG